MAAYSDKEMISSVKCKVAFMFTLPASPPKKRSVDMTSHAHAPEG